ncbi:ankyrin repeat domain-containing protein [Piscinibacter terrae]|uniref:Ankyrin repeat domain-containing protein n=1 Tax=Piscinibacter terrae TaxID=2496871 RepID=A0A3N7HJG1_9BURK|nr:ankyrin repeat domain-containing protein [Albitalea terrae]RQP22197.1 ankyrin repeat domain-containing protein [Albitalea terrae]
MKILKKYFKNSIYLFAAIGISSSFAGSYDDFFKAVDLNDTRAVQALLQRGFDANSRDSKGQTGLFLALRGGAFDVAELLIKAPNLDVNAVNEAGESALMMAALKGQPELSQRLIERGAAVDKTGWSPLHYAATGPDPAVVKLLLDRGASIDARSPNGSTPLMMASQYGSEASAALLLQRGADPRIRNDRGLTAVDFARLAHREALAASLERAQR